MERLYDFVRMCDVFGEPVQLNLLNKNKHQSRFSGCISIIIFLFFFVLSYQGLLTLIRKEDYKLWQAQSLQINPAATNLNASDFVLAIKSQGRVRTTKAFKTVDLVPCTTQHFTNVQGFDISQTQQQLRLFNLSDYRCLPLNYVYVLQGQAASEVFQYLEIFIERCSDCSDYRIETLISSATVNAQKSDGNLQSYVTAEFTFHSSPTTFTEVSLSLDRTVFQEDTSILPLVNMISTKQVYQLDSSNLFHQQVQDKQGLLGRFTIKLGNKLTLVHKSYPTLDILLSYIGGLMKIVLALAAQIMQYYNRFGLYVLIANKLYNFNVPEVSADGQLHFSYDLLTQRIKDKVLRANQHVHVLQKGARKIITLGRIGGLKGAAARPSMLQRLFAFRSTEKSPNDQEEMMFNDKQGFLNVIFDEILRCQTTIKMMLRYLLARVFCRKLCYSNTQVQLIDEAVKMVKNDLDIMVIMDRIQEIDKLKRVVLSDSQLYLFDYTPKPVIKIEKKGGSKQKVKFQVEKTMPAVEDHDLNDYRRQTRKFTDNYPHLAHFRLNFSKRKSLFGQKSSFNNKKSLFRLQQAYENLQNEMTSTQDVDVKYRNGQLMLLLGKRLVEIFETSHMIDQRQKKLGQKINIVPEKQEVVLGTLHNQLSQAIADRSVPDLSPMDASKEFYFGQHKTKMINDPSV